MQTVQTSAGGSPKHECVPKHLLRGGQHTVMRQVVSGKGFGLDLETTSSSWAQILI